MSTPDERHNALIRYVDSLMGHREANGGKHLHHRDCIHNLTPEQQIEVRGMAVHGAPGAGGVDWWLEVIGPLPEQITPEQWECEPPL